MIVLVVSQNQCKITTKIPYKQILNDFCDNIIQTISEIGEFYMIICLFAIFFIGIFATPWLKDSDSLLNINREIFTIFK